MPPPLSRATLGRLGLNWAQSETSTNTDRGSCRAARLVHVEGERMEQIDVRRGMARFGVVVLVLWEAFVIFSIVFLMVLDNPLVDVWDLSKVLLIFCVV